jgi:hypothetical protein
MIMSEEQLERCKEFAKDNLSELAFELIEWHNLGVLRDGRMRELGEMFKPLTDNDDELIYAEKLTEKYALEYTAKCGKI